MHRRVMQEWDAPELCYLHLTVTELGAVFDEGENEDLDGRYTAADEWWKTVQVCLRLMQQRVFAPHGRARATPDPSPLAAGAGWTRTRCW